METILFAMYLGLVLAAFLLPIFIAIVLVALLVTWLDGEGG